jgi:hypothetical protein
MFRGKGQERYSATGNQNLMSWLTFLLLIGITGLLIASTTCTRRGIAEGEATVLNSDGETRRNFDVDVGWQGIRYSPQFGNEDSVFFEWTQFDQIEYNRAVDRSAEFYGAMTIVGWICSAAFALVLGLHIFRKLYFDWTKITLSTFAILYALVFAVAIILFHVYGDKFADSVEKKLETTGSFNVQGRDIFVVNTGDELDVKWNPDWGMLLSYIAWLFWLLVAGLALMLPKMPGKVRDNAHPDVQMHERKIVEHPPSGPAEEERLKQEHSHSSHSRSHSPVAVRQ